MTSEPPPAYTPAAEVSPRREFESTNVPNWMSDILDIHDINNLLYSLTFGTPSTRESASGSSRRSTSSPVQGHEASAHIAVGANIDKINQSFP
jgi:hypothetical protein